MEANEGGLQLRSGRLRAQDMASFFRLKQVNTSEAIEPRLRGHFLCRVGTSLENARFAIGDNLGDSVSSEDTASRFIASVKAYRLLIEIVWSILLPAILFSGGLSGCLHRQTDLEWALSTGAPIDTSASTIRSRPLKELEVMVELYGVARWRYPIAPSHVAGSPYGMRMHPIHGREMMHKGQDIPCNRFEPIYAVARGKVVISKRSATAGKYIQIQHVSSEGRDVRTSYMHMSTRRVWRARTVRKGKMIGRCGSTGLATGPHLHFEVRVDGSAVAPLSYVEREDGVGR